jgi:hypothetical protein
MQLTNHPLWRQLAQHGWQLEAPAISIHATPLNIIVARPPHVTHT